MTTQAKIKKLADLENAAQSLRQEIESIQSRCRHRWGPPEYNPTQKMEPSGWRNVHQGSHFWQEPTGYLPVDEPRWQRECSLCGKIEYTTKMEIPASTKKEPVFD